MSRSDGLLTLRAALERAAEGAAGVTFVARKTETTLSYADLLQAALRRAGALVGAGVARGDVVVLAVSDPEQFLLSLFGVTIAGAVPALVAPPSSTVQFDRSRDATMRVLETARAAALLTDTALASEVESTRERFPSLQHVLDPRGLDAPPLDRPVDASIDDMALVQFTSGSTSSPKGVALTHRSLASNVAAIGSRSGLAATEDDVAVSWLPLYHDMGLIGMVIGAVYTRCRTILMTPHAFVRRPVDWLRTLSAHRGTISYAPSFGYDLCVQRIGEADLEGLDLSSWRVAGCGAEPVHVRTLTGFASKFARVGFRAESLLPCYGLAEHVVAATIAPRDRPFRFERVDASTLASGSVARLSPSGSSEAVEVASCGRPLPGHELRIVGEDGDAALPERVVGEIVLRGPSLMAGYFHENDLTTQVLRGGALHTGDLGYLSDGEVFVCGRKKDIIIANGRKYHPSDIEGALLHVEGVRHGRVVAFGVSEPGVPDKLVVLVEAKPPPSATAFVEDVRRGVAEAFGLFVHDVVLLRPGAVGRTTSGKVQRAATKERYLRGDFGGKGVAQES